MRKANTTFVNLRSALDDLDPLVDDAKPVVRDKLIPFLDELRPFARDARPAVRELSQTVRKPGADNDLVELLRRQPALDQIANQTAAAQRRRPARARSRRRSRRFEGVTKQVAFLRPYAPDLVGWFDDFSTTGAYDALGNFSRAGPAAQRLHARARCSTRCRSPPSCATCILAAGTHPGRNNRCPGSIERRAPDGVEPLQAVAGLQLRRHAGADRAMSLAALRSPPCRALALAAAARPARWLAVGARPAPPTTSSATPSCSTTRSASPRARTCAPRASTSARSSKLDVAALDRPRAGDDRRRRSRASPGFRADVFCEVKPQSLIGEYYLDCDPGKQDEPGAATRSPSSRPPARSRPTSCSTSCAARRASASGSSSPSSASASPPAARTSRRRCAAPCPRCARPTRCCAILDANRRTLNALTRDADRVLVGIAAQPPRRRRASCARPATRREASASRASALRSTVDKLPGFLRELRPTLAELGTTARAADARRCATCAAPRPT